MALRPPNSTADIATVARTVALLAAVTFVAACATRQSAPVEDRVARPPPTIAQPEPAPPPPLPAAEPDWRPRTYTVKAGDTLQKIALDHGLDYRELTVWNNLDNPNLILVGQTLRLTSPSEAAPTAGASGVTTAPLRPPSAVAEARPAPPVAAVRPGDNVKSQPKALKEPYSERAVREVTLAATAPAPIPAAAAPSEPPASGPTAAPRESKPDAPRPGVADSADSDRLDWAWPVKGKLVGTFSETANLKGIDIAGKAGEPVLASAPGRVVYAGSGLRGYGKLIIIKHNNTYLSAYAHNREIVVKEGQQVGKGQKIAEMGNTDADQVKLHFEIRRLGRPMDPVRYLPPA